MPGSLYPRSPSMDLEDDIPHHRYVEYEVPVAGPSSSPERGLSASAKKYTMRPRSGSFVGDAIRRFSNDGNSSLSRPSIHTSSNPRQSVVEPPVHSSNKIRRQEGAESGRFLDLSRSGSGKGKQRALDPDHLVEDTSREIRVRGKERELVAARQEQKERERRWEQEVNSSGMNEERHDYEEKIQALEEEVKRLREELARRPAASLPASERSYSHPVPPPPPPPPPPTLTNARIPTAADTGALFASVRAGLKHAGSPVEAPINGVVYGGRSVKRAGQPTVNVPSDKMAAFLTEMKTVRLRKVNGGPADLGRRNELSSSQVASREIGRIQMTSRGGIQRPSSVDPISGGKRKRAALDGDNNPQGVLKRRLTAFGPRRTLANQLSRSLSGISSTSSTQPVAGPSTLLGMSLPGSQSYPPLLAWPSSSIDGTEVTPSLTSDNDVEHEAGDDDKLPPTPPTLPASDVRGPIIVLEENGKVEATREIPDVHMTSPKKPTSKPGRATTPVPAEVTAADTSLLTLSMLEKRPPTSPMPVNIPRKPRGPVRTQARLGVRGRVVPGHSDEEDDDPLLLTHAVVEPARARPSRTDQASSSTRIAQSGSSRSSELAQRVGRLSSTRSDSQVTNAGGRRRTLDEEFRLLGDGLSEEDWQDLNQEPEVFVSHGSRNTRTGFLAHGGAGGKPVYMGEGYVEGVEDESEEDRPVPKKTRPRTARRR
ncbi:hypothetical protein BV25DRAFT_1094579 [Artomyces pyxidatus]|uniref:Uncharacterized protein n=1 Tax=Artomyces pyxidatus TaxID=48021 RepID=A0ACB8TG37_9AGAM|nr:hypothetical protein BV25DRAFT_1094579 [Artomyces pyxidatus]